MKIVELYSNEIYEVYGYREGDYQNSVGGKTHYLQFLIYGEVIGWCWVDSKNFISKKSYLKKIK